VEHLTVIASLVAAAFDRVRLLFQRNELDKQARSLADKGRALEDQVRHLQRLESAGQLASGIAHDFNNLLTAIAGHAELSLGEEPPAAIAESLQVILQATKRGAQLTHNLLSFSRRRVLSRRTADLNEIVDQAQRLILPALRSAIALRFSPADDKVPVFVDEVEIEHAVINLVTNARDAIPDAGAISIDVRTTQLTEDFVTRHEGKLVHKCAVVSIRDTGSGIPGGMLDQVFEPFFTTKGGSRGTGLGLATVRSLVDQHGGVVTVESELGQGTTFSIYLPLATGTLATPQHAARTGAGGGGETILLAEDDDMVRALLVRVLRGHGYEVLEASDGQTAIDLFRAESARVRLVLTDLMMPRRTGLELVNAVLAFQQQTAIVVMSGYTSDPAGASHLSELGIPVISKPTTPTEVLLKIRQVLDGGVLPAQT
jgi:signal transduction histidine kinase/CheY-like chemotaxis protein